MRASVSNLLVNLLLQHILAKDHIAPRRCFPDPTLTHDILQIEGLAKTDLAQMADWQAVHSSAGSNTSPKDPLDLSFLGRLRENQIH